MIQSGQHSKRLDGVEKETGCSYRLKQHGVEIKLN